MVCCCHRLLQTGAAASASPPDKPGNPANWQLDRWVCDDGIPGPFPGMGAALPNQAGWIREGPVRTRVDRTRQSFEESRGARPSFRSIRSAKASTQACSCCSLAPGRVPPPPPTPDVDAIAEGNENRAAFGVPGAGRDPAEAQRHAMRDCGGTVGGVIVSRGPPPWFSRWSRSHRRP